MKNTMKKIIVLLFSAMISLSALGMLDYINDRKVMLSSHHYYIQIKESVLKKIRKHNVSLEIIAELYNSAMEDPSIYCSSDETILVCNNQLIYIFILKSDKSIVDFILNDEENN